MNAVLALLAVAVAVAVAAAASMLIWIAVWGIPAASASCAESGGRLVSEQTGIVPLMFGNVMIWMPVNSVRCVVQS
jgi:hypothetical protein